ncbi:MAG: oligopeptide transporter, OPT family, partial [Dehalococcoidia bacterium]
MATSEPQLRAEAEAPYIPASTILPEITIKAFILGALLSVILAAANAYLGLFAGITVSASIPAAVISMAVLRLFRQSNILENNIVQTSASAGESLAAGVIFTMPALIILGVWAGFDYLETTMIAGLGGVIGVIFTIPLRRALIVEQPLKFPEGVATAEVLKVGDTGGAGVKYIAWAAAIGALFKFGSTGLRLWGDVFEKARYVGGSIAYIGTNLSPALVAVGYIVGLNIATLIFIGGAINWLVAIPIVAALQGMPEGVAAVDAAGEIWSSQTRYLGVGAMVVGGLWALISVRKSLVTGIKSGIEAYRRLRRGADPGERTERDTPMQWVGIALAVSVIPLFLLFLHFTGSIVVSAVMAVVMLIAGFLFSAVAAYMAGLVGSSNNPISGVTIATILAAALLLLAMLGSDSPIGPASAIFIGAVVACAAAIAGDNMQDLKAGRILGATPYKQQIMQALGVIVAALVMAPV